MKKISTKYIFLFIIWISQQLVTMAIVNSYRNYKGLTILLKSEMLNYTRQIKNYKYMSIIVNNSSLCSIFVFLLFYETCFRPWTLCIHLHSSCFWFSIRKGVSPSLKFDGSHLCSLNISRCELLKQHQKAFQHYYIRHWDSLSAEEVIGGISVY